MQTPQLVFFLQSVTTHTDSFPQQHETRYFFIYCYFDVTHFWTRAVNAVCTNINFFKIIWLWKRSSRRSRSHSCMTHMLLYHYIQWFSCILVLSSLISTRKLSHYGELASSVSCKFVLVSPWTINNKIIRNKGGWARNCENGRANCQFKPSTHQQSLHRYTSITNR